MWQKDNEQQLLEDASVSDWLKKQILSTHERDCIDALDDAKLLVEVVEARLNAVEALNSVMNGIKEISIVEGKTYSAVQPAHSFGVIEGEEVSFDEKKLLVKVLAKPSRVIVLSDCGSRSAEELPAHLQTSDWYWVLNLDTNRTHWLNSTAYTIGPV